MMTIKCVGMLVKGIPELKGTQMKRCVALVSLTVLLVGGLAQAAVEEGDTEINLGGYYQRFSGGNDQGISGPTIENYSLTGGYGYFVTDHIQLSGLLGYSSYASSSGGYSNWNYFDLGIQGKYHFMIDQPLVPYVGLEYMINMGLDYGNQSFGDSGYGTQYGIGGGARYEMSPRNDFFIEIWYKELTHDWTKATMTNVDNLVHLRLGIIHQFN